MMDRRRMRLLSFRPLLRGALRGFACVELPIGLKIKDVPILISNGKAWASLPAKPVLGQDGKHVEVSEKKQYAAILEWRNRQLSDGFSNAVVAAVRASHPDALAA